MKKAAVVGFDKSIVESALKRHGFDLDKFKPDAVISFGGDGSALMAEQLYPGVPRLMIKHSKICEKCIVGSDHAFPKIFGKLKKKQYKIVKEMKLEGTVNDDKRKRLVGLNEINVAHAVPTRAMRFDVSINRKAVATDLIGDGVVVATPYGSTAYFRIITGRRFSKGIGIAFNNVNKKIKYRLAREGAEIKIKMNRGPALMCADNNTTMIPLKDGDVVTVKKSKDVAKIIKLTGEETKVKF
jgi:NAD+ kinase